MCGLAGFLVTGDAGALEARTADVAGLLRHRGPDSWGAHVAGPFGVVHTRLAIVDLSPAGAQPFTDDRYVLAFNGELYNHAALRASLPDGGASCRGGSDTATLFALLRAHGVEATLPRLKGMFAFAWYDTVERQLWLARDRFGIKPLVWAERGDGILFASEQRALRPWMPLEVDPVQLLFTLAGVADRSWTHTVFRGVRPLPPGHLLALRAGERPVPRPWFRLTELVDRARHAELARMPRAAVVDEFGRLFAASTRSMLMGDAPMGAFVSGGIDSGLVAATASPMTGDFTLFTADVVGTWSELAGAQALARHLGRPLEVTRFEPGDLLDGWAHATEHYELPIIAHTNALPFAAVAARARRAGVKAILSGEGSDELFLGYPRLLTTRYDWALTAPLRLVRALYGVSPRLEGYVLGGDRREEFVGRLVDGFGPQARREAALEAFAFLPRARAERQALTLELFGAHLLTLLHRNDRMGMSASIEARFPYLDEDVVAFGVNLPVHHKTAWTSRLVNPKHPFLEDKAVVRALARRVLPAERATKPKLGFPILGHTHLRVRPGFFAGGFVGELLRLDAAREALMLRTQAPYFVAKLASVEVFGRLFALGHGRDEVTARVHDHVALQAA